MTAGAARLLRYLQDLAHAKRPCPGNEAVGNAVRIEGWHVPKALAELRDAGAIVIHYDDTGRRSAVSAGDGSWRVACLLGHDGTAKPAPRKCLRCRDSFKPEHRGRFTCDECWKANCRVVA